MAKKKQGDGSVFQRKGADAGKEELLSDTRKTAMPKRKM